VVTNSDKIQNEDYNQLRTNTSSIYVTQWGQSMRSVDLSNSDTIEAAQLDIIFKDIQSVHVHQTGSINAALAVPTAGLTIGADTSQSYNQSTGAKGAVTGGAAMGHNDYIGAVTTISNYNPSHLSYPAANFTPSSARSSTRTATWGIGTATQPTTITHIVTATFASVAARNYFFNAGGQIAFSASASNIGTGASQLKNQDWADLLAAMSTVYFDKHSTSASSGTSNTRGSDDLTSSYQTLFTKTGSGNYNDNYWQLQGRNDSSTVIRFRINISDSDAGTGNIAGPGTETPIDEPVTADITSNVLSRRPDSSFVYNSVTYTACDLPHPTLTNITLLTAN
jgi:hypothetical protein